MFASLNQMISHQSINELLGGNSHISVAEVLGIGGTLLGLENSLVGGGSTGQTDLLAICINVINTPGEEGLLVGLHDVDGLGVTGLVQVAGNGDECGQLCLDPGLGFGKTYEDNLEILQNTEWLKFKGVALMIAGSRKRFIGTACGETESAKRDPGTVAAHTAAIAGGADIIRAHDVFAAVQGARVADAIYRKA